MNGQANREGRPSRAGVVSRLRNSRAVECFGRDHARRCFAPRNATMTPQWTRCVAHPGQGVRGFTLTEVLIALTLSLVIMAAVYSALSLHWRFTSTGRVDQERMQLVRAIATRIERDLRSVVYVAPPMAASDATGAADTTGSTSGGSSSGTGSGSGASTGSGAVSGSGSSGASSSTGASGTTTSSTTTSGSTDTMAGPGLYGSPTQLLIHASRPSGDLNYSALDETLTAESRMSDTLSVAWFLAGGDGALASSVAGPGLARMEGDRLTMQLADTSGDVSSMASRVKIVAPEVTGLEFRYFDGVEWATEWDSTTMQGLPFAVEVTFTVSHAGYGKQSPAVDTKQRIVVSLPAATLPQEAATEEE